MLFEDIKPGDRVRYWSYYYDKIITVTRVTKTMIMCDDRGKYSREDGHGIPRNTWHSSGIAPLTPEVEAKMLEREERDRCYRVIHDIKIDKIPTEVLQDIASTIEKYKS